MVELKFQWEQLMKCHYIMEGCHTIAYNLCTIIFFINQVLKWRTIPVLNESIGSIALSREPLIRQVGVA